jgi:hypothetical protein
LVDSICHTYVYRSQAVILDYSFLFQLAFAAAITTFYLLLTARSNNLVEYVMVVLLDPGLMGLVGTAPSFACHLLLTIAAFGALDQMIVHARFSEKWLFFFVGAAVAIVVNLTLFADSAVLLLPLAVAALGLW